MQRKLTHLTWLAVLIGVFVATTPVRTKAQNQQPAMAADTAAAQDSYEADRLRMAIARDKAGVVADLMSRWSDHIQNEKGLVGFERAFMAADPEKLLKIAQARTWDGVIAASLGVSPNALGSQLTDLVFNPITPCRVMDTRFGTGAWAGPFSTGAVISFYVTDPLNSAGHTQGGQANCGFPFDVGTGVALNVTVVPSGNSGDLKIYPYLAAAPNASIINFYPGVNLANAADTRIALSNITNDVSIMVEFATNVHIVVDVMGYYSAPNATALDTTRVAGTTTAIGAGGYTLSSAVCPSGYSVVGGGFNETAVASGNWIWQDSPTTTVNPPTFWTVRGNNLSGFSLSLTVYAVCARVPGR